MTFQIYSFNFQVFVLKFSLGSQDYLFEIKMTQKIDKSIFQAHIKSTLESNSGNFTELTNYGT